MTYGTIKRTYAELYNAQGELLFSLQAKDMGRNAAVMYDETRPQGELLADTHKCVQLTKKALQVIQKLTIGTYDGGEYVYVKANAFEWAKKKNYAPFLFMAVLAAAALNTK